MRLALAACVCAAGCATGPGFGVDVTLRFDASVSDSQLAEISTIVVTASGDESGSYPIALSRLAERVERFVYRPQPTSRTLGLSLVGQASAAGAAQTIASGEAPTIALSAGGATAVTITLSAPTPLDAGLLDGAVVDQAHAVDLAGDGGGVTPGTLVQQQTATGSGVFMVAVHLGATPATGDVLVVATSSDSARPVMVGGAGGATFTEVAHSAMHVATSLWMGVVAGAGDATIAVAWTAAQNDAVVNVSEWTGLTGIDTATVGSGSTSPIAIANGTTGGLAAHLCVASAGLHAMSVQAPANGYTAMSGTSTGDHALVEAYKRITGASVCQTSWTEVTPNSNGWDALIVSVDLTP